MIYSLFSVYTQWVVQTLGAVYGYHLAGYVFGLVGGKIGHQVGVVCFFSHAAGWNQGDHPVQV
jgi:hypothetical protein